MACREIRETAMSPRVHSPSDLQQLYETRFNDNSGYMCRGNLVELLVSAFAVCDVMLLNHFNRIVFSSAEKKCPRCYSLYESRVQ